MELVEILQQFEKVTGEFPRAAVEAAVARQEEVTPELLRILEETIDRAAQIDAEGDYMAHLYAMFLLAQFREIRAYPLVVRFALLPEDIQYSLSGDFITESLGQVLASVCGGDLSGIQSLIENESADQWVRGAALFRGKLMRQWSHVWDTLVAYSSDLYAEELLDDIKQAYDEGLVDPSYIDFKYVKEALALGKDRILARLADDPHRRLVSDTVAEMETWAYFREDSPNHAKSIAPASANSRENPLASPQIKRSTPKTGRNEPCPCGSGKKYKKCCGA